MSPSQPTYSFPYSAPPPNYPAPQAATEWCRVPIYHPDATGWSGIAISQSGAANALLPPCLTKSAPMQQAASWKSAGRPLLR